MRSDHGRTDPAPASPFPIPLQVKVHPRSRRFKLRLAADGRSAVLTVPPRACRKTALGWAGEQAGWVEAQLSRMAAPVAIAPGALIPIDGVDHRVEWSADAPRKPHWADGRLRCGGPLESLERRVLAALRAHAAVVLAQETRAIADPAGITVAAVAVGDARTRWGSCSADGRIRYNWRLVMAPPDVRRWVVAHEVAHRRHMDHGAAFHALEARLYGGDPARARALLRAWSARLKRIGGGRA